MHEDALAELNALDVGKKDKEKKQKAIQLLTNVQNRQINSICDIQANIEDTKRAIKEIKRITIADTFTARQHLDAVLEYWGRRWWMDNAL